MARILIVEDQEPNRALLHAILAPAAHHLTDAITLREARELLKSSCFDLVLLNIRLPDGSGWELLNEVRNNPATSNLPVIVITADIPALVAAGTEPPVCEVLSKPIDLSSFRTAVNKCLQHRCDN
jgi:CheY-like chemotaxis protein